MQSWVDGCEESHRLRWPQKQHSQELDMHATANNCCMLQVKAACSQQHTEDERQHCKPQLVDQLSTQRRHADER